ARWITSSSSDAAALHATDARLAARGRRALRRPRPAAARGTRRPRARRWAGLLALSRRLLPALRRARRRAATRAARRARTHRRAAARDIAARPAADAELLRLADGRYAAAVRRVARRARGLPRAHRSGGGSDRPASAVRDGAARADPGRRLHPVGTRRA